MDEKMNAILTPDKRLNGKKSEQMKEKMQQTYQKQGCRHGIIKMPQIVSNLGHVHSQSFFVLF
jgi:hypothetical protein